MPTIKILDSRTVACVFALVALPLAAQQAPKLPVAAQEGPSWNRTLERIASGVVSIQIDSTRSFDTERNSSAQATGFVVDAQHGIILTNRHVVTPGPVRAQAVFLNQEEVDAHAGLSRSDPRLRLLPVRPEAAPVHEADRAQARARGRADRARHPRRRQRRGRAAVDPRRHDRAARPRRRRTTAAAITTTSTRSICRPRRARRAARRARRSSTSRAASSR